MAAKGKNLGDDGVDYAQLTGAERKKISNGTLGSAFDISQRMFPSYQTGNVFDYGGFAQASELHEMLSRDGKARGLEQVLTLPLRGANCEITGANAEFVNARIPNIGLIVDQMTSAVVYRKAFFEKEWGLEGNEVYYKGLHFRPAIGCSTAYNPKTGNVVGFKQRRNQFLGNKNISPKATQTLTRGSDTDLTSIFIPHSRAFIYIHGLHREPLLGVSDLEVAQWAYQTRQKIMFLWFQFLENTSLPSTVVFGNGPTDADVNAESFRQLKASGVMGMTRPGPGERAFETVDSSGAGASQFMEAVNYLEAMMSQSVLAGFMDLTSNAARGAGSYALSADQSEFFLHSRQAVADEMSETFDRRVIKPLVAYNMGADAEIPHMKIGPISKVETGRALTMLSALAIAPTMNVPLDFVGMLTKKVAGYLGLDEDEVAAMLDGYGAKREAEQQTQRTLDIQERQASIDQVKAQAAAAARPTPAPVYAGNAPGRTVGPIRGPGVRPPAKRPPSAPGGNRAPRNPATAMSNAVSVAYELIQRVEAGEDPHDIINATRHAYMIDMAANS